MSTVTARISQDISDQLDEMAASTKRSKSFLVAEALKAYLEAHAWQVARTHESLVQADHGKFASQERIQDAFEQIGLNDL